MACDFQQCGTCDQQSLRSACADAQSDQSFCKSLEVKLLIEHHVMFLSLTGGYTGSSESTLVKISHCWKSHVAAHYLESLKFYLYMQSKEEGKDQESILSSTTPDDPRHHMGK